MEHRLRDARCALRGMLRTPLRNGVAALSLAFGIAADTTIFSTLDALLIRPLPHPDADRLVPSRTGAATPGRRFAWTERRRASAAHWRS